MKKTLLLLNGLLFLFSQHTFAGCQTIAEGSPSTISATSTGSACYRYYVSSGNMPVFTLKHKNGQADFDIAVYSDSRLSSQIGSSSSSGPATELLTLSIEDSGKYLYVKVTNYSNRSGTYELYAKQIDFAGKIGEALAETAVESTIEWALKVLLDIDEDSSENTHKNVARTSTAVVSMLQGKSLAGTSRDLLIDEIKRGLVGDGFISDFAVNYAISIIEDIYEYY